ncbi:hypothetical protein ABT112_32615 [Streptomyces sp. NPDC002055]|uniref:hypothetical protein n=1 Tax=Streptomyces sp. NPDC002055 TaxID=3154534 RepID=UPI003320E2F8
MTAPGTCRRSEGAASSGSWSVHGTAAGLLGTRRCEAWLSRRPDTRALTGPDLDEGRGLADEVLSTVTEFNGILDQKVTVALAECVRVSTPDLAFRLLLQALSIKSAAMFPDAVNVSEAQYARLEALGRAFHYGEFVVGDVEHLTE